MAKITFLLTNSPPKQSIIQEGTNLMTAALTHGLPVGSSCGGKGICGKCVMAIVNGNENLNSQTTQEEKFFKREQVQVSGVGACQRLSCQTQVNGDVEVKTTYW